MNQKKKYGPAVWFAGIILFAVLLILDRISKNMVTAHLAGNGEKQLIGDLFVLHYLENNGAAFGILQGKQGAFLTIAVIVLIIIVYVYVRMPYRKRFLPLRVVIVSIAAGAIGNMIDRITQGYVVDFLYIKVIDFPVFNVADIYVTCGCILLIIFLIFVYKDAEFQEMAMAMRPGAKKREEARGDADEESAKHPGEDS